MNLGRLRTGQKYVGVGMCAVGEIYEMGKMCAVGHICAVGLKSTRIDAKCAQSTLSAQWVKCARLAESGKNSQLVLSPQNFKQNVCSG